MGRPALIALLIVAAVVAANPSLDARRGAAAPQGATPAPTLVPGALCLGCNEVARWLSSEQAKVRFWQEELKRELAEELNDVALDIIRNEIRRNREQRELMTQRYEATGQQAFADRIKELDAQYDAAVKEAGDRARQHQRGIDYAELQIYWAESDVRMLEGALKGCNRERCSKPSAGGDPPSGTGGPDHLVNASRRVPLARTATVSPSASRLSRASWESWRKESAASRRRRIKVCRISSGGPR